MESSTTSVEGHRQHHLQLYNPPRQDDRDFRLFSSLPIEIRLYIWELAIPPSRFLRVRLSNQPRYTRQQRVEAERTGGAEDLDANDCYRVTLEGTQTVPALLHVTQESRAAALRFYRVQIPCRYNYPNDAKEATFYCNPEHDVVKVHAGRRSDNFVRFVRDMRDNDRKGVGLANLALSYNDLLGIDDINLDELGAPDREALTKTLANLRQVWFCSSEKEGRMYLGPLNGVPAIKGWELHRSRPIMGATSAFETRQADPRPIEKDLQRVFLGTSDPRMTVFYWNKLLQRYEVTPRPDVQHRFMLASTTGQGQGVGGGGGGDVRGRQSAFEWIKREEAEFKRGVDAWQARLRTGVEIPRETPEELAACARPAFGFWLFPIQALGELPPTSASMDSVTRQFFWGKRVVDLSKYRPELGLFDLP
jgi:hypothetical protein